MKYRLAYDIGTNSLGWALLELNELNIVIRIITAGVRIFPNGRDPKSKESLAIARRVPRAARRRRDRYLQRRKYLMSELIKYNLMPHTEAERKALEKLDPYELRANALNDALPLPHLGRAIFHLNQRRGFQSNRIVDKTDAKESGKIKSGEKQLENLMKDQEARTYGEFLYKRHRNRESVRIRLEVEGSKALYDFYPTRDLYKDEFNKIWDKQAEFHQSLNNDLKQHFFNILFFQRPLKEPQIGKCTFFPEEERLSKAHPLSQERRIYQDLNHLKLKIGLDAPRHLTIGERDDLAWVLMKGEDVTFKTGLRKIIKDLPPNTITSAEEGGKADRLVGNQIAARLGYKKGPLKKYWSDYNEKQREDIVHHITDEPDEDILVKYLKDTYGLDENTARKAANVKLPEGHDNLGLTATKKILAELKKEVITYDKAVQRGIGASHSDFIPEQKLSQLPYYGTLLEGHTLGGTFEPTDPPEKRYGKIANPTVHIALNQIRHVTNEIIKQYGNPEQIIIELARDLKITQKQKDEINKQQKLNEDKNKDREATLEKEGLEKTAGNIILLRLWEELGDNALNRRSVYSGRNISLTDLFSGEIEIEHILPYSRTLDDSMANKTLAYREENRGKRNKTPYEAYDGLEYEEIRRRAQILPPNKRWRFEPDAIESFLRKSDFAARQLNDTRHIGKIAKKYLSYVVDPYKIWVSTGQLTAMIRVSLGLNSILSDHNQKVRTDHRHHAIDAIAVGICDRSYLNKIAKEAGLNEDHSYIQERVTKFVKEPFPNFRDKVKEVIYKIIVSHKKDHGTGGALHNETNYGINVGADRDIGELITRKPINSLTYNEIDKVRDKNIRDALIEIREETDNLNLKGSALQKELATRLDEYGKQNRIRRVRILKKQEDYIEIGNRKTGEPYRAVIPGENYCIDIIEKADGKWVGVAETFFDVNQNKRLNKWKELYPNSKFIMRVHKGDMLKLTDEDGVEKIKKVIRLSPSNGILYLVEHNQSGDYAKRHADKNDPFQWDFASIAKLKQRNCKYYQGD